MSEFQYENSCQSMPTTRASSSIPTNRKKSPMHPGSHQQLVSRRGMLRKTRSEPKASTRSNREYLEQNSLRHAGSEYFIDVTSSSTHLRRTKTQDDIPIASTQSPDLLELFNSFQISAQDQWPPATRVLVKVSLVGCIKSIRLLVEYNSSIKDVIRASLKAYAKEGLVPRKFRSQDQAAYGLHYSPFCLQSINPMEALHCLGTRNFFLYPNSSRQNQLTFPLEESQSRELCCYKEKPWRSFCGLVLGWITPFLQWFSKKKINFYPWVCY